MEDGIFEVRINLGNDAMKDPNDVIIALRDIVEALKFIPAEDWPLSDSADTMSLSRRIRDSNGNTVGYWSVEEK